VEDLKKLLMNRYKNVIGYSETLKNEIVGGVEVQRKAYRVYVSKKLPKSQLSPQDILPDEINGIPVDVVELGEVKALSSNFQDPTKKYRPIFPGISVGHYLITAGTIGAIVRDKTDGKVCILSNCHVLANSNKGKAGDAILQPGPYDSGRLPNDQIGTLKRFVEILHNGTNPPPPPPPSTCPVAKTIVFALNHIYSGFGRKTRFQAVVPQAEPENFVDCAIADLTADYSTIPNGLVAPTGIKVDVSPYQTRLIKSGRTTGITVGTVFDDNATVDVSYGDFTARFVHQIVVTKLSDGDSDHFSQGGDSGSGVYEASVTSSGITSSGLLAGLLFAGSDTHTIVNHIQYVLDGLGVEVVT